MKFKQAFTAQPKWMIVVEMVCLSCAIGFVDHVTGWEVSLFVFYGIPIFITAWMAGRPLGIALAVLSGLVWYVSNLSTHTYQTHEGYLWAGMNRLFYFAFVAVGGAAMRRQREQGLERIAAITLARNLELEVIRAGEREQIRIGQDLHDGVCQNLAAIDCATACLREELEAGGLPQAATAATIQEYLKETIVEARNLARGIFPVQVETDGLVSALGELATKASFIRDGAVSFTASGKIQIEDPQVAVHLYRIAQEAMSNAARHANTSRITVNLLQDSSRLVLTIADDGCGFTPGTNEKEGLGLRTMRYRAQLIGGSLAIRSGPDRGTVVECTLNLPVVGATPHLASRSS